MLFLSCLVILKSNKNVQIKIRTNFISKQVWRKITQTYYAETQEPSTYLINLMNHVINTHKWFYELPSLRKICLKEGRNKFLCLHYVKEERKELKIHML